MTLILTNSFSIESFGYFSQVFLVTSILTVIANIGSNGPVIKYSVLYINQQQHEKYKAFFVSIFTVSMILSLFLAFISFELHSVYAYNEWINLYILLPFMSFALLSQQFLRGAKLILSPFIFEKIVLPTIMLGLMAIYYSDLKIVTISNIYIFSYGAMLFGLVILLYFKLNKYLKTANIDFEIKEWYSSLKSTWYASIIQIITSRVDYLFVLFFLSINNFAGYIVILKISLILVMFENIIKSYSASIIADLYQKNKIIELEKYVKKNTFIILSISSFFVSVIYIFDSTILSLFGTEYLNYSQYLLYFLLAQAVSNLFLFNDNVILMSGNEKKYLYWMKIKLLYSLMLLPISLYFFNLYGLAFSMIFINFILGTMKTIDIKKSLNIDLILWKGFVK
jgi:O-antigen/teichoic acid export membrane protein